MGSKECPAALKKLVHLGFKDLHVRMRSAARRTPISNGNGRAKPSPKTASTGKMANASSIPARDSPHKSHAAQAAVKVTARKAMRNATKAPSSTISQRAQPCLQ